MVKQPCNVHRSDLLATSLQNFNQRTIAGTVTKNDIWRAAIISITTRSLEPLTDRGGTLNITRPHDANNSRMNLLYQRPWTNGGKCVQSNQTARKKKKRRKDCVWDPATNKKTSQSRGVTYSRNKSGKVFVTGPHNAKEARMITGFFRREGNWRPTFMCFQTSWRARLHHGGVMSSACPHIANTRRTISEQHNQD